MVNSVNWETVTKEKFDESAKHFDEAKIAARNTKAPLIKLFYTMFIQ